MVCNWGDVFESEILVILLNNVDLPVFSLPKIATVFWLLIFKLLSSWIWLISIKYFLRDVKLSFELINFSSNKFEIIFFSLIFLKENK